MSERDQSSAGPQPGAPRPRAGWESDTTPGLQAAGSDPYAGPGNPGGTPAYPTSGSYPGADARPGASSGTGASAVGAGRSGGPDIAETRGYPRHGQHEDLDSRETAPEYSTAPVRVRRPDVLAALLLVLAGVAAGISLLLDWVRGVDGWNLVDDGLQDFDAGSWPPPVIVLAGGALLVLGLLVLLPARSHRTLGVLALFATIAALTGVVVRLDTEQWTWDFFEAGFWVAAAVPLLGLLGSLKAMLTGVRER